MACCRKTKRAVVNPTPKPVSPTPKGLNSSATKCCGGKGGEALPRKKYVSRVIK